MRMIRSFRHKGVERFFKSGSRAGIQAAHAPRLLLNGMARITPAAFAAHGARLLRALDCGERAAAFPAYAPLKT